jgi:outer membrane protein assembly factor BamA
MGIASGMLAAVFAFVVSVGTGPDAPTTQRRAAASDDDTRSLEIAGVEITGRDQVSRRQIVGALEREGLVEGAAVQWPADPRIARARERLRATGYFKAVALRLEPVAGTGDQVRLVVAVSERSSIALEELYLGSSRLTPFHGGLSVLERNFLGRSVHVGGALVWGTMPRVARSRRQQAYRFVAEVPRLGSAPLGVRTSAFFISSAEPYRVAGSATDPDPSLFRTADVGRIGGTVGLVFPVLSTLTLGVDYRFERVDALVPEAPTWARPDGALQPVDLGLRQGPHRLTSAHLGLVWNARNEVVLAGKGARVAFDLQLSSPATGSQYEYVKLVIAGGYTFRLPWRHWITPSISGGQIAGRAPVFEQFYAGDLSAWTPGRELGIRYSTRNPIDVFGTGVDRRTFGSLFGRVDLDYSIPLFRRARTRGVYGGDLFFGAGLFTLAGDAAGRRADRRAGDPVAPLGFNANLGFRLDTAAGTFSVSVGNVLRRSPL